MHLKHGCDTLREIVDGSLSASVGPDHSLKESQDLGNLFKVVVLPVICRNKLFTAVTCSFKGKFTPNECSYFYSPSYQTNVSFS